MTIQMVNVHRRNNHLTLMVFLFVILASITLPADPNLTLIPCIFKSVFHIPCPGCGMTRAFILLGHFHFQEALTMNINSILVYIIILTLTINGIAGFMTGRVIKLQFSGRLIIVIITISFFLTLTGWYYNLMIQGLI